MQNKNTSFVSVIIPCRNEEKFIGKCLDSIIVNDYSKDKFEILVVDGMSTDGTKEVLENYSNRYSFIKFLNNPRKNTAAAMNIGIKNAEGEIIIIMSAHAEIPENYISKCIYHLNKLNADNVGGVLITLPGKDTYIAKAISLVLSHPFGVGNSWFRIGAREPMLVDTVPFGCYRKAVFDKIGGFNERLIRAEDNELNSRIRKNGGKIYLVPDIKSYYYARSNLKSLWKQNFSTGKGIVYANKIVPGSLSLRHFIPGGFVLYLLGSLLLSFFIDWGKILFGLVLVSYLAANLYFSITIGLKEKKRFVPFLILSFITLHLSYGFGSIFGVLMSHKSDSEYYKSQWKTAMNI